MKFLLISGLPDLILSFRGPLIAALQARGVHVHVAGPGLPNGHIIRKQLESRGVVVHCLPMRRTGTNPLADARTLGSLWLLMSKLRPQVVLAYGIKPVIYGLLAARLASVPGRFALICGLGYAFQGGGQRIYLRKLAQFLYWIALPSAQKVFFQNPDDEGLFRKNGMLGTDIPSCVVNGSGVDIERFAVVPLPKGAPRFVLIARLLGDKGVREYVEAARVIRGKCGDVFFGLVGWIDDNPNAIAQNELDEWIKEGVVQFLGRVSDVRPAIAGSSVFVLPSYGEGTPLTVLEAMAMGRAIITTDAPGCRETVVNGENGFLVPIQSVEQLVNAMERFIFDPGLAHRMGGRSRMRAEDKYDVRKVNGVMLAEMKIP